MKNGVPYKQAQLAEQWDVITIDSGIGGLTAAVLLGQHAGKRVLVLERHYKPGGFTHTFDRPGTNGMWGCTTSARCRMSARACAGRSTM